MNKQIRIEAARVVARLRCPCGAVYVAHSHADVSWYESGECGRCGRVLKMTDSARMGGVARERREDRK